MIRQLSKKTTAIIVAAATALITLMLTIGAVYLLGFHSSRNMTATDHTTGKGTAERKIAYWRAPMNPTEIYDKPGKSAMGMDLVPVYADDATGKGATEPKIVYWRAPMNPTEIYDKPGKSAMGMDLVPVYENEVSGGGDVSIDPVTQQNMGVRTALVEKGPLTRTLRTYGHVTYDETRTAQISPKISGWIEKIHVDFAGKSVEKDEVLFEIYSPELLAAQEEYLSAVKSGGGISGNRPFLQSSRRRLEYFDVPASEIQRIETTGQINKTLTIRSPLSGVVIMKNAEQGSYIKAGTTTYRIADLSKVWVEVHIYEYELPWVTEGQTAIMSLPYQPGKSYKGKVSFIYPYLQVKTRDMVVLLEFDNPDLSIKPDMYADVQILVDSKGEGLLIPSEAVIRSGKRNVVFVTRGINKFSPRDVTLGLSLDGRMVQVLTGLAPGETVVTSGQFLLDSESKLREAVQKMMEAKQPKKEPKESADDFFDDKKKDTEDFFNDMK